MSNENNTSELDRNKATSIRFNDQVKNRHNFDAIDELLSDDFINHSEIPGFPSTRAGVKAFFAYWVQAFPDLTCTINDMVAEGDKVVDYFTIEGTHQGEFLGIPATGRRVKYNGMHIFSYKNGQITGHWNVMDFLTQLIQLGVVPTPQQVVFNDVPPSVYRPFGFPSTEELGNMFQIEAENADAVLGLRNFAATRALNPALQSFDTWLAAHEELIPQA